MIKYRPGDDVGPLEDWPFGNPASAYDQGGFVVQTSGRIDQGGPGHKTRFGIWRCTKGVFDCTEQGDELMTILSGRCRVIDQASDDVTELGPGDSFFTRDGRRVTWDVIEDVTKVFFGHKADGF